MARLAEPSADGRAASDLGHLKRNDFMFILNYFTLL